MIMGFWVSGMDEFKLPNLIFGIGCDATDDVIRWRIESRGSRRL